MSAYATSSPSSEQTRWYLIRPPSLACTWRNDTSWDSVAAYSFTGTLTSPNETAPFQIARIPESVTRGHDVTHASDARHPRPTGPGGRGVDPRGEMGRRAGHHRRRGRLA